MTVKIMRGHPVALMNNIGIKLYDGSFVPILKENEVKSKRVILTTVRDNQEKTIIELYEGSSNNCINNEFLGKLVIPINRNTGKGQPAIEVHLRLDSTGILYAKAWDVESGEESEVQIEHSADKRIQPETMSDIELDQLGSESTSIITEEGQDTGLSPVLKLLMIVGIACVGLSLIGLLVFGVIKFVVPPVKEIIAMQMNGNEDDKTDRLNEIKRIDEKIKDQDNKESEKERRKNERLNKHNANNDSTIGVKDREGKTHYIRWGDNLWNICKHYYGDPWYYPSLAEYNELPNRRKIYAGKTLVIPPKSKLTRWDFSR
jgi:hypothetical protein